MASVKVVEGLLVESQGASFMIETTCLSAALERLVSVPSILLVSSEARPLVTAGGTMPLPAEII